MLQLFFALPLLGGGPVPGHWRATLGPADSPADLEVPFDLVFAKSGEKLTATVENGPEKIEVPELTWKEPELVLAFPYYDSSITAKLASDGKSLSGEWKKRSGKEKWTTLEFRAQAGDLPRFPPVTSPLLASTHYSIEIEIGGSNSRGTLVLNPVTDAKLSATVLTPTGDLRYLAGTFDGTRLRLSEFDGFFAFSFDGRSDATQQLAGTCRMGGATGTWKATTLAPGAEDDGFAEQSPQARFPLAGLTYSDVEGQQRALAEPLFDGHPMVIELGGSWCPNCHDEMHLLAELDAQYATKGLAITGLCFEYSGDFERDALQARRMLERHGAKYRVLLGGTAAKGESAKAFPVLEKISAFPTTLFIRRDGSIAALHEGFAGPATGAAYAETRVRFTKEIEALLESPAPDSAPTWKALTESPWRDEREGWFVTVKRDKDAGSFEAEEMTRWDRPTAQGVVASGEVRVTGQLVKFGKTFFRFDPHTVTFYDAEDLAHRMVVAVRPHLPVFDGVAVNEPDDLATAMTSMDPRKRAETRYHLVRALKAREQEPRFEPWRGIDDEDPAAQCAAVWAAGELQRRELAEPIAELLDQPFAPLRREAVRALGKLGYEPAQPVFERMAVHDIDGVVRALAKDPPKPPPPPRPH